MSGNFLIDRVCVCVCVNSRHLGWLWVRGSQFEVHGLHFAGAPAYSSRGRNGAVDAAVTVYEFGLRMIQKGGKLYRWLKGGRLWSLEV